MDTSEMLRPDELPFKVTRNLAESINELIAAIERDDINVDCYLDQVECDGRELPSIEEDMRIRRYYAHWGWLHHGKYSI